MDKKEILETALELNKELLKGYSLEKLLEIDSERLSDADIINRTHDSALYYETHFEKLLNTMILEELRYIGENVGDEYLLLFSRGKLESFRKLKDWFEEEKLKMNFPLNKDED